MQEYKDNRPFSVPPLRAHDFSIVDGHLQPLRWPKEDIRLSERQRKRLTIAATRRINEEEFLSAPESKPAPEPIAVESRKPVTPARTQHNKICLRVAALVRDGWSYPEAMNAVLEDSEAAI